MSPPFPFGFSFRKLPLKLWACISLPSAQSSIRHRARPCWFSQVPAAQTPPPAGSPSSTWSEAPPQKRLLTSARCRRSWAANERRPRESRFSRARACARARGVRASRSPGGAEWRANGGLRAAGAGRSAGGGHGRAGRRLEEARPASTAQSGAARRRRARQRAAVAMQRRRRAPPPSQQPEGGGRGEEVAVQFSAGRLGSATATGAAARGAEDDERLEREHFWKIINAFRYYG